MLLSERMPFQAFQLPPTYDPTTARQSMAFNQYPSYLQQQQQQPQQQQPQYHRYHTQQSSNYRQSQMIPSQQAGLPRHPPALPQQHQPYPGYAHAVFADPRDASPYPQPQPHVPQSQQIYSQPRSQVVIQAPVASTSHYVSPHQPRPVPAAAPTVATTLARSDYATYASPTSPTKSYFPRRPLPDPQSGGLGRRPTTGQGLNASPIPSSAVPSMVTEQMSRHRPSSAMSMNASPIPRQVPSALARHNTVTPSPSPPRPLPNPASRNTHSFDLPRSTSPIRANAPSSNESRSSSELDRSAGQKFVPLWKRALPIPGPSKQVPQGSAVADRRGVVSPTPLQEFSKPVPVRPLPTSPGGSVRSISSSSSDSSQMLQLRNSPDSSASKPSTESSPTGSAFTRFRDRSRMLPGPSGPAPTGALPSRPISAIKGFAAPTSSSPEPTSSSDDDDFSNNPLLTRQQVRTPSPDYGIRDLPSRTKGAIANGQINDSPTRASTLPQASATAGGGTQPESPATPTSYEPKLPPESSFAFRMAASQGGQIHSSLASPLNNRSPLKSAVPLPVPPALAGPSRWPSSLPHLPNPPASPGFPQSHRSTSPSRSPLIQNVLPTRNQSLRNPVAATVRQSYMQPPSLDDTPPRSLRRTPSPDRARPPISPKKSGSPPRPSVRTKGIVSPTSINARESPSTATPASATSLFSLSQFPRPPSQVPAFPPIGVFPARPAHVNDRVAAVQQQQRQEQHRTQSSPQSPSQSFTRQSIPKISFPTTADSESEDDAPVIVISGSSDAPAAPKIEINGLDDGGPQIPFISVSGEGDVPQIAVSGIASGSSPPLPPPPAVVGKGGLVCGGCGGPIIGRIVSAMGARWHPGCFRCCVCDELLENLSSYEHEGRPFCHLDYHEKFAPRCYHCQTAIVDELFVTLDDPELGKRTYHELHFFCAECGDPFLPPGSANRSFSGDGVFKTDDDDDVGFTVYHGHPYCEACHVRLRMPKCKKCKKSIRDGMQAVEALGGKWCWECFTCSSCEQPFENPSFFLRDENPFCERCFSIMIKSEL